MTIAIIFAGGTGQRMHNKTIPKQFLELNGKPILVYTLEQFQNHEKVDGIVLVMLDKWIPYSIELLNKFSLSKVIAVVSGGHTGQQSIANGIIKAAELYPLDSIVLIHDGVRPLIDSDTISKNIACVQQNGSAITVSPAIETIVESSDEGIVSRIIDRSRCQLAKAPQGFILGQILDAHKKAIIENRSDFIDSACIMQHYGYRLHTIEGSSENIKITTPIDYQIFKAIIEAKTEFQNRGKE